MPAKHCHTTKIYEWGAGDISGSMGWGFPSLPLSVSCHFSAFIQSRFLSSSEPTALPNSYAISCCDKHIAICCTTCCMNIYDSGYPSSDISGPAPLDTTHTAAQPEQNSPQQQPAECTLGRQISQQLDRNAEVPTAAYTATCAMLERAGVKKQNLSNPWLPSPSSSSLPQRYPPTTDSLFPQFTTSATLQQLSIPLRRLQLLLVPLCWVGACSPHFENPWATPWPSRTEDLAPNPAFSLFCSFRKINICTHQSLPRTSPTRLCSVMSYEQELPFLLKQIWALFVACC